MDIVSYEDALIAHFVLDHSTLNTTSEPNNIIVDLDNGVSYEKLEPVTEYNASLGAELRLTLFFPRLASRNGNAIFSKGRFREIATASRKTMVRFYTVAKLPQL